MVVTLQAASAWAQGTECPGKTCSIVDIPPPKILMMGLSVNVLYCSLSTDALLLAIERVQIHF